MLKLCSAFSVNASDLLKDEQFSEKLKKYSFLGFKHFEIPSQYSNQSLLNTAIQCTEIFNCQFLIFKFLHYFFRSPIA
jgi:hypothetical protein